ncbi:MAG: HIT family protein [Verrucomicrobiales bacterium]|nr:HIT family protein [Verrucomicrobiales bacterium]
MPSIFTRILQNELPASFVHRDEVVAAFLDIQPLTPGHTLVVPVREVASLSDLPPEILARVTALGQEIGLAIRATDPSVTGINWLLCDGPDAGQEVPHIHLHVIPRRKGDGLRFGGKGSKTERADLDDWAARIETCLKDQMAK